jgi:hypothetical protein
LFLRHADASTSLYCPDCLDVELDGIPQDSRAYSLQSAGGRLRLLELRTLTNAAGAVSLRRVKL